ncbi:NADPH-dependent F420 reductase [Nocardioides houyundeii]|uniref:NADPH-dependent F420 reductase n=1 Tax=Nocardioides houyundeii TaxID=2045452 RepID=UPI0019646E12|nr:NAD(P)-binding domain-containing protein [Nocardioides houyundeii]
MTAATSVMDIGMLGAGEVAQAIAGHAVSHGHQVTLSNRRGPRSIAPVVDRLGPLARGGTPAEAARAPIVLLAVPWTSLDQAVASAAVEDWDGRIVIDATNHFAALTPRPVAADLGEVTGSEHVASLLPGARVVKAFNTLYGRYIAAAPRQPAGRQLLFVAGDDREANDTVAALADEFGFAPVVLDGLRDGGRLMQLGGPLSGLHALRQPSGSPPIPTTQS